MSDIDLVIFDCDGVLVDSEMIASRVLAQEVAALGYPLTDEESRTRFTGMSIKSVIAAIEADWHRRLPETFEESLRARDRKVFAAELHPVSGIREVLPLISIPKCVASSGVPEKIRHSLTVTGLIDAFDGHLFSARQVERGKPAPDLFLFAAHSMGVAPGRCLVIEDSVAGLKAGLAAGMRVLGFAGASHCGKGYGDMLAEAGAEEVFSDMARLPGLL